VTTEIVAPSIFYAGTAVRGSERIRCDWIAPHIPATKWKGGDLDCDVAIFQKVPPAPKDDRAQILDMADPIWRTEPETLMRAMLGRVDAVTVPTEALRAEFVTYYDTPAYVVRDGHDFSAYPRGTGGTRFVWFGYADNFPELCREVPEHDLAVVSDRPTGHGIFYKWADNAFDIICKSQIAILPFHLWKSNNKAVSAWAMGLAVARDQGDLLRLEDPSERAADINFASLLIAEYSAEKAGREMRAVIEKVAT